MSARGDDIRLLAGGGFVSRHGVALSHAALFAAATIYSGFNLLAAQALNHGVSPVGFSVVREAFAFPLMYIWAAVQERPLRCPPRLHRLQFLILGVTLAAFQLCFAVGVAMTDATTAALFQCLEPSTAALLGALLRREQLTAAKCFAAVLAGSGVVLMILTAQTSQTSDGNQTSSNNGTTDRRTTPPSRPLGSLFLFLQGVGIACYCLLQKSLVQPGDAGETTPSVAYGPVTVTAHAYCASLGVMLLAAAVDSAAGLEAVPPLSASSIQRITAPSALVAVAYAVVLSSCVGYSLRAWANKRLDASTLVLYNAVQPPLTALLATMVLPGKRYGVGEAGGTVMVMAAVLLSVKGDAVLAWGRSRGTASASWRGRSTVARARVLVMDTTALHRRREL